jgi:hypothetical protein
MGYDKFEAREWVAYGNGTSSDYAYNPRPAASPGTKRTGCSRSTTTAC